MKSTNFYLEDAQAKQLAELSKRTGIPKSQIMRWGISRAIEYYTEFAEVMRGEGLSFGKEEVEQNEPALDDDLLSVGE